MPENKLIPIPATQGVNLLVDSRRIADEELAYAKNLFPKQPGLLATRGVLSAIDPGLSETDAPLSLCIPPFFGSSLYVYATKNRVVSSAGSAGVLYSSNFSETVSRRPFLLPYQQSVYCFPGVPQSVPAKIVAADGITDMAFTSTGNTGVVPQGAVLVNDRMVYFNLGPGFENYILWSDPNDPTAVGTDVLADNGRALPVYDGDGDRIVMCATVMLTSVGGPPATGILVLKEFSAYLITGEPGNTDASTDDEVRGTLAIKKFSFPCGCSSAESLVSTPYGTVWAGHDDVWMFHVGQVPTRIGSKIRPALLNTPAGMRYLWHAAYFNGVYRLAIMSPGQGPSADSGCGEQWWLDLREGSPNNWQEARWWGPQVYNLWCNSPPAVANETRTMAVDTRPGVEPVLLGLELVGSEVAAMSYDAPGAYDTTDNENTQDENEVYFELWTKDYDLGDPMTDKLIQGCEVSAQPGGAGTIEVDFVIDGGRDIVTVDQSFASTEFLLDTDVLDTGVFMTPDSVAAIDPPDTTRHQGKRVQLRIRSVPFEVES